MGGYLNELSGEDAAELQRRWYPCPQGRLLLARFPAQIATRPTTATAGPITAHFVSLDMLLPPITPSPWRVQTAPARTSTIHVGAFVAAGEAPPGERGRRGPQRCVRA